MPTIEERERATEQLRVLELDIIDKEISEYLKKLPSQDIDIGYPLKLQTAKSLHEIVPLLKEILSLLKKGNNYSGNCCSSQDDVKVK